MLDGMNMGMLFNCYTTPQFTLPGEGMKPGQHALTFDLASNTHQDMEDIAEAQLEHAGLRDFSSRRSRRTWLSA